MHVDLYISPSYFDHLFLFLWPILKRYPVLN